MKRMTALIIAGVLLLGMACRGENQTNSGGTSADAGATSVQEQEAGSAEGQEAASAAGSAASFASGCAASSLASAAGCCPEFPEPPPHPARSEALRTAANKIEMYLFIAIFLLFC
jgi:hypothetical protein